jgi:hypothetical protein
MNVTFRCPHCDQLARVEVEADGRELGCPHCRVKWPLSHGSAERVSHCLLCSSTELFVRKDFSQPLGIAIVVIGFVASSIFWYWRMPLWTYAVLFGTALIDVILYLTMGDLLECYRCRAQYRNVQSLGDHPSFDLETHEKHRQQRIRLQQQTRTS